MAAAKIWSNVQVAMQSVLAAAVTITALSKASPGVATAANTYVNGDYVLVTAQGMSQVNGRVFRVSAVSVSAFTLEGEDTTLYDTFTSGTAQKITYGTSLGTVKGLSSSGGDFKFIDTTTIHDTIATQIPGLANPISYDFENIWDVSDAGLIAMKSASDAKAQRAIRFTFSDSSKMVFNSYVGCTLLPAGNAQDLTTTKSVLTLFGRPTYYTT